MGIFSRGFLLQNMSSLASFIGHSPSIGLSIGLAKIQYQLSRGMVPFVPPNPGPPRSRFSSEKCKWGGGMTEHFVYMFTYPLCLHYQYHPPNHKPNLKISGPSSPSSTTFTAFDLRIYTRQLTSALHHRPRSPIDLRQNTSSRLY